MTTFGSLSFVDRGGWDVAEVSVFQAVGVAFEGCRSKRARANRTVLIIWRRPGSWGRWIEHSERAGCGELDLHNVVAGQSHRLDART